MTEIRAKWTRDEVILALDLLLNSEDKNFSMNDERIIELSELLSKLPIIPLKNRNKYFRNTAGVRRQILTFYYSLKKKQKASHVGIEFYNAYIDYKKDKMNLNKTADAIKRCMHLADEIKFADKSEMEGFREGALLAHLHRYFERSHSRHSKGKKSGSCCSICGLKAEHIYTLCDGFLQFHLLIPPEEYREGMVFTGSDFMEVCPNCHRVLHQKRPWVTRDNAFSILKTY
jgi:5-methylcytosine-specific restriction protein A